MKLLLFLGLFALTDKKCNAMHQESSIRNNSGCYGASGKIFLNMSCPAGGVISIKQIWAGVKEISTGCPSEYDISHDTSCCSPSANQADDCTFAFDHTNFTTYHDACQGQQTCSERVKRVQIESPCNQTIYHTLTTFAYVHYFCVDATELNPICTTSANITSNYTYITSEGFPSAMTTSTSPCNCSVQTDDPSATLQVVTIQRIFTRNTNGACDQSLTLFNSGQNEVVMWTCDDNTYVEHATDVNDNYVILSMVNNKTVANGTFWVEVRAIGASANANLTLSCPAILVETTTASTTTITDITSTTTDTTFSSTTTSTTTTDMTTTTTDFTTTSTDTTSLLSTTTTTDASTSKTTTEITTSTIDDIYSQSTITTTDASTPTTTKFVSTTNADDSPSSVASTTEIAITTDNHTTNFPSSPESTDDSLSRTILIAAGIVAVMLLAIFLALVCIIVKPIRKGRGCCSTQKNKNDVKIRPAYTNPAPAESTVVCETEHSANKETQTIEAKKSTFTQTEQSELKPPTESVIPSPVTHVNATPKSRQVNVKHKSTNTKMKKFARPKAIQAVADVRETYSQASVAQRNQETATLALSMKERTSQTVEMRMASRSTQSEERYFQDTKTRETDFKSGLIKLKENYLKPIENKEKKPEEAYLETNATRVEEMKGHQEETKHGGDLRIENMNQASTIKEVESDMKLPELGDKEKPKRMQKTHQEVLYNKMFASFFDEERTDVLFQKTLQQYKSKKLKKRRGQKKKKLCKVTNNA